MSSGKQKAHRIGKHAGREGVLAKLRCRKLIVDCGLLKVAKGRGHTRAFAGYECGREVGAACSRPSTVEYLRVANPVAKALPIKNILQICLATAWITPLSSPVQAEEFPIVRHANQAEWPFMFQGEVMNESKPRWPEYRGAIARFDDLDDCFTEQVGDVIDPVKFIWRDIRQAHGFEVCLFRIATSLNDIEAMQKFIESLGYSSGRIGENKFDLTGQLKDTPDRILSGGWEVSEKGVPFNYNFFLRWSQSRLVWQYTISMVYSGDGRVLDVATGSTSE